MSSNSTILSGPRIDLYRKNNIRIGILHSGGPAPGGNRVHLAAALRAKDHGISLVAFKHGYEHLMSKSPKEINSNWVIEIGREEIRHFRDQLFLLSGSARANPGKKISTIDDLKDSEKTAALTNVLEVFGALNVGAIISVGGDDSMRTANLLQKHFENQKAKGKSFGDFEGIVHVPKTVDKDYPGIDFTFVFMTAAQVLGDRVRNLHADARATATSTQLVYHVVEIMGRAAGWLTAAASIYGNATLAIVPEDYIDRDDLTLQELAEKCVDAMLTRKNQGKNYGVLAISEGLGDVIKSIDAEKDEFGHTRFAEADLRGDLKRSITKELAKRCDLKVKIIDHRAGYESRQVSPNIFDDLLCKTLGVAAVDAILKGQFGNMLSVEGVFSPKLVPFDDLIDPVTLKVKSWVMSRNEGLHKLMKDMQQPFETDVDKL